MWQSLHMYHETCAHEPLPVNQSGVKVVIAGFAKMGTRTLSRTLFELGYNYSYHGEELLSHVWHPIAYEYWARPENGGLSVPPIGTVTSSTYRKEDVRVLNNTSRELLAKRLSTCRTDAVAFDGAEGLFWPVYEASPDVKVDELTPLRGRAALRLSHQALPGERQTAHKPAPERLQDAVDAEKHAAFFQRIDKVVPQERRLEVDPRKTTYEELCSFLEIKPCKKSGRLPRAINLGNHEFDFSPAYMLCFPVWVGIHWLNWRFVHWLLPL
eukprot:UN2073